VIKKEKYNTDYSADKPYLGRWEIQARLSLGIYRMDSRVSCVSGGSCVLSGGEKEEKKCILKMWNSEHRIQAIQHSLYTVCTDMDLRILAKFFKNRSIKAYKNTYDFLRSSG
jgi:hypothetical protein